MNEIQTFNNTEFGSVRTIQINDEPYFIGKDVADILGYVNSKDALATHVDSEDKGIIQRSENATFEIPNRGLTVINESGLYSLILSSKLPTAKKFKRWVTSEVLPTIRKHGAYAKPQMTQLEMIAEIATSAAKIESKLAKVQETADKTADKLEKSLDIFTAPTAENWQNHINMTINNICKENKLSFLIVRSELYKELERTARCNLSSRVRCKRERMNKAGCTYKECKSLSKIDIINGDAKLKAIFDGIVKKFAAKYIQHDDVQLGCCD